MDNLRESQYQHQLRYSEPNPQLQTQEEWEMQMLQLNSIKSALEQGLESALVNEIQVRYYHYGEENIYLQIEIRQYQSAYSISL